jgi:type I restriction enzyme R subunit
MPTDTSERGLESLIVDAMTGRTAAGASTADADGASVLREVPAGWDAGLAYVEGDPADYDRAHCIDLKQLLTFIETTQPEAFGQLGLGREGPSRDGFLARLQGEIAKRGIIDVLRRGVQHHAASVQLFYGTPTTGNAAAAVRFSQNIFSVTRQLRYSLDATRDALDLGIFINGLPVATFELKNRLTGQTVEDAVLQYQRDRDPREPLFQFKRCLAHFAVDDQEVRFCTRLAGKDSWFLPFNKGWKDGAGNPPNPDGIKTDYLWREVLTREGLADIVENYAQVVAEEADKRSGRRRREEQIFPRYHQLDLVRKLLVDAAERGAGHRYLIQHSAGSGKSNSIAWLAHQLVGLRRAGDDDAAHAAAVFDSVIVVTDRVLLDKQLRDTIKQFSQVGSLIGHAEHSGQLKQFIEAGKKIVITTVQKFPVILNDIGDAHRDRHFAIIIDEAHSSQGGRAAAQMNAALSPDASDQDEDVEDKINALMSSKKMLSNASYFAFTATPKNKTLEIFGERYEQDGVVKHRPFHSYTMKQAIQEGFILDVLAQYTPVHSYYRLDKTTDDDPEFDTKRANKKLRRYVDGNDHAIRTKAEIMVDHFHEHVQRKIGGQARAMIVTSGIERAIQYFHAVQTYLVERKSPYRAIVAFSGEPEYRGETVTEASMNGFPSREIAEKVRQEPYRFLICADKFQTGYDEPLLHTMYVDKKLSGIKAVQTLSRLNRAYRGKTDTFVLDFQNDADTIQAAFEDYYKTTILSGETDPNKLHDLKRALDDAAVYAWDDVEQVVALYLGGAGRDQLDPILDARVAEYGQSLDEDGQVAFKGSAKTFVRTYGFLASVLAFNNAEWEKLSIFLSFLVPKLPAPQEEDLAQGILDAIDMDSYRAEKQETLAIILGDEDAEIDPVPMSEGGRKPEPELDRLSNIVLAFNERWGNIPFTDRDKIGKVITEEIPPKVAADRKYQNAMRNSDRQNARIEADRALGRVLNGLLADQTELFKQYSDNEGFRRWLADMMFGATYQPPAGDA